MLPHLNFFIGVDTGITHLATCFDIPSIVIYHPDFPASKYGPIDHPRLKIIQAEYSSDKDKFKPLKSITAKMAIRVFKKLL